MVLGNVETLRNILSSIGALFIYNRANFFYFKLPKFKERPWELVESININAQSIISIATKIFLPLKKLPFKMDQIAREKHNDTEGTLFSKYRQGDSQAQARIGYTPLAN